VGKDSEDDEDYVQARFVRRDLRDYEHEFERPESESEADSPSKDSSGGESSESEKETGSDSEAFYGDYGPPPPSPSPERDAGPSTFEGDLGAGPSVPKRGRGRPPGSKNKNKVNPEDAPRAPDARRKGKRPVKRELQKHAADWSKDIITNNIHKFKGAVPGGSSTRASTSRRQRPVLKPIEYFHHQISEEMLQDVLDATNQHWHDVRRQPTRPKGFPENKKWPPSWSTRVTMERTMADLKKFLGVLFALGVGNNARMSIKEMTSDLRIDRFVRVGFLTEYKITADYMSNWFMNLHLQPDGWENSEEAKRPKTVPGPGSRDRSSGGGGGGGGESVERPHGKGVARDDAPDEPVERPHGKGVARDDGAGPSRLPLPPPSLPIPNSVSPEIPVSAARGIWSAKDNRFYTSGIVRDLGSVGFVFAPPPPPLEPRPRATRRFRGPRDSRDSVTY
jgi:hypothetical protein